MAQKKFKIKNLRTVITNTLVTCFVLFISVFIFSKNVYAQSSYVLPYPSSMPGSIFYQMNLVKEGLLKYWYFGSFGKFNYNLFYADKYLVEAKTLFEYKQYFLAMRALKRSDSYFRNIYPNLQKAKIENKNRFQRLQIYREAVEKHVEELVKIDEDSPDSFFWEPEKGGKSILNIKGAINYSINIRKK